ncbi:MAG: hypothetical protein WBY67_14215, partial [Pseudolabrys sp.]
VKLRPVRNVKGRPSFAPAFLDYGADKKIKQAGNRRVIKSGRECRVLVALQVGLGCLGTRKFNPLARRKCLDEFCVLGPP